jgi:hypothetical protein
MAKEEERFFSPHEYFLTCGKKKQEVSSKKQQQPSYTSNPNKRIPKDEE